MARQVKKYTKEFKQESVTLALKSPSIAKAAEGLGIPIGTLHSWVNQLKRKPAPPITSSSDKNHQPDVAALLEENRRLHKENIILKEEKEILKKAAAYFAQHLKYEFIKANSVHFSVERMCDMFSIERSGYYAWVNRKPSKQKLANESLDKRIIYIFNRHSNRYGYPPITNELHDSGERCGKNRVFRRMKCLGLKAKAKKKFTVTTDSKHNLPVASNLLNRDFTAMAPNQKWVSDITYIWTEEG